jgi:hypothetical protein
LRKRWGKNYSLRGCRGKRKNEGKRAKVGRGREKDERASGREGKTWSYYFHVSIRETGLINATGPVNGGKAAGPEAAGFSHCISCSSYCSRAF